MGNTQQRVVASVDQIIGILGGVDILDAMREGMLKQKVFRTMFGQDNEKTGSRARIYIDEIPSKSETILPLLELQVDSEVVEGSDLRQRGFINGRILFPNNLSSRFKIYRTVALTFARWFDSDKAITDFLKKVPGLTECGENLDFTYDVRFNYGELTCPALIMRIPFVIDLQRMRVEDGCTDLKGDLDAKLLKKIESYFIEITDDEGNVLIEKSQLYPAGQS